MAIFFDVLFANQDQEFVSSKEDEEVRDKGGLNEHTSIYACLSNLMMKKKKKNVVV
jgi:hypothetical protein